jgi:hypothetical protein
MFFTPLYVAVNVVVSKSKDVALVVELFVVILE